MRWEVRRHLHLRQAAQGEEGASPNPRDAVALGDLAAAQTPGLSHQPADESQGSRHGIAFSFLFWGGKLWKCGEWCRPSAYNLSDKKKNQQKVVTKKVGQS